MKLDEVLLGLGIRPEAYRTEDGIVLLRPQRLSAPGDPLNQVEHEVNSASDLNRVLAATAHPGALCYHEPDRTRLASFDAKSPFGQSTTFTSLVSELSPSGGENRRRFVHAIAALDAESIFDGGWLLPLGQEASLAEVVNVYRRLPAARFETLDEPSQPVTIRYLAQDKETIVYFANDSAWPVDVALELGDAANVRLEALGGAAGSLTHVEGAVAWTLSVPAYGLVAGRLVGRAARPRNVKIGLPDRATAAFEARIKDLSARAASLSSPAPLAVLDNPGFELGDKESLPGWTLKGGVGAAIRLDAAKPHGGERSLVFESGATPSQLRGNVFAAPTTGRMSVLLWLKTPDAQNQPAVRLAIEAKADDIEYLRYATLGVGSTKLTEEWAQYIFQIDDLPTARVTELRVRIDLLSAGRVEIDDLQLYDLAFAESERLELNKLITLASYKLQSHEVCDSRRFSMATGRNFS